MPPRLLRSLALVVLLAAARLHAGPLPTATWQPRQTYAFVVGVLEWRDAATWPPFPKTDRRDRQLVRLLEERGVPTDHIVYLEDRAATREAVVARFQALLARTGPDDLVVVYYAGHGYKERSGRAYFATWDAGDDMERTSWPMDSVVRDLEERSKAGRALLLADCCYSGTLAEDVRKRSRRVGMACLTSSSASVSSTGAWTFTEAVLLGLRGNPVVDGDHDGAVTVREMARFTSDEMAFADEQRSTFTASDGFDAGLVMAPTAAGARAPRLGEHVEVLDSGTWWRARVIDARRAELRVHYYGYEVGDDAWVTLDRVRERKASVFPKAAHVEVLWKKTWYPATVLSAESGLHHIHYDGYEASWDEWVSSDRIRKAASKAK